MNQTAGHFSRHICVSRSISQSRDIDLFRFVEIIRSIPFGQKSVLIFSEIQITKKKKNLAFLEEIKRQKTGCLESFRAFIFNWNNRTTHKHWENCFAICIGTAFIQAKVLSRSTGLNSCENFCRIFM